MQSEADKRIVIGKIGAPHGIRGELKVFPLTDFPDRFKELKSVYVGDERLDISSVRYQNQIVLIRFEAYPVREQAASLTGRFLSVPREEAVPLEEGQYYISDIVGLEVFDGNGSSLGIISEVLQTGSNDVYVVSQKGRAKQILVPALKSVVKEINVAEGRMLVVMPEEI